MHEEHGIHVLEDAGTHELRLGSERFFSDAGPEHERTRQLVAVHDLLHRERGGHDQRLARVVPSPWPGAPGTSSLRVTTPGVWLVLGNPSISVPSAMIGWPDP